MNLFTKTFFTLFALFCLNTALHASFGGLSIDLSQQNGNIGKGVLYLEDESASLTFDEVVNIPEHDFKISEKEIISHLFTTSVFWYRFDADNKENDALKRIVSFKIPWLDEVNIYIRDEQGEIYEYAGGDTLAFENRTLKSTLINFEHIFKPGSSNIYIRVKTRDPFVVPMSITDISVFLGEESSHANFTGFIYGIVVAMILYNMILFFNIRAGHYAFYVLYLSMFLIMNASYNCYTFKWVFYDNPVLQNWAESTTIFLFAIAGLFFAKSFLNLKNIFKRLNRATNYIILLFVTVMLAGFAAGYHYHVMSSIILATVFSLYAFSIALYSLLHGNIYARFFLLGTTAGLLGTSLTSLTVMAVIPYSGIGFHAIEYGMAIDAILLSFALADKMKNTELEKIAAQNEAKKAMEAKRAKEEFLSNMSHEIRTPMNAIIGFIHILKNSIKDETNLSYINIIHSNSQTLLHLIDDVLDLSKIESGKVAIEKSPFNPYKEFESIGKLFEAISGEKSINFNFNINASVPYCLEGDIVRIKQIVFNFLNNAFKFTPEGKGIFVDVDYRGSMLCISVKDEGIGISDEAQNRIFNAFEQADNTTSRKYGGTGLGLSISLKLAHMMKGSITLESKEGEGSLFTLRVPLDICMPHDINYGKEDIECSGLCGHILVAEDNKMNQQLMKILLDEYGLRSTIAKDGAEALELFKSSKFDLVFMDDSMPNMTGIESLKRIRGHEREKGLKRTPVAALTANVMQEDKERFFEAGADDFVSKPIDILEFNRVLERFLPENIIEKR